MGPLLLSERKKIRCPMDCRTDWQSVLKRRTDYQSVLRSIGQLILVQRLPCSFRNSNELGRCSLFRAVLQQGFAVFLSSPRPRRRRG